MSTTPVPSRATEDARRVWELAVLASLRGRQEPLNDELNRLAAGVARRHCQQLAHRGAPCNCTLDGTRGSGGMIAHSAFAAAHETTLMRWVQNGSRGRPSGVRAWLQSGAVIPFLDFDRRVLAAGRGTDVHRRWNVDRSLPAKAEAERVLAGAELAAASAAVLTLPIAATDWEFLADVLPCKKLKGRPAELRPIQDPRLWLEALFIDATQPAISMIDSARVYRFILWSSGETTGPLHGCAEQRRDALVERVCELVDQVLADCCPDVYDHRLARARAQTRAGVVEQGDGRDAIVDLRDSIEALFDQE